MDVSVIVVSYNTADLLACCIDSVLAQVGVSVEIIVVDNASQDQSRAILSAYGPRIQTIYNDVNVGFGAANNIGFDASTGRYVYLLNPDAILKGDDALSRLMQFMDAHPEYGVAGSQITRSDSAKKTLPQKYYPGQRHIQGSLGDLPGTIAWILGASMIIRREVYLALGGFDEAFFLYAEEADFCLRARQSGHAIGYCEAVTVEHIGGASERKNDIAAVQTRKQKGLHLFYTKHFSAADVVRLLKRDKQRAWWRMQLIGIKQWTIGLTDRQKIRQIVYRTVFHTSTQFLQNYRHQLRSNNVR